MFGQNAFGNSSFGANQNQNKPAFGGFGATTTSQPTFGGGLFGQQQQTTNTTGGKYHNKTVYMISQISYLGNIAIQD